MKTLKSIAIIIMIFVLSACSELKQREDIATMQDIENVAANVQNELEKSFLNDDGFQNLFETAAVGSLELLKDYEFCFFPYETRDNIDNYYYNDADGEQKTNDSLKLDQKTKESINLLMKKYPDIGIVMINTHDNWGQTYPNVQFYVLRTTEIDQKVYVVQEMILFAGKDCSYFEKNGYKRFAEGWYSRNEVSSVGCG